MLRVVLAEPDQSLTAWLTEALAPAQEIEVIGTATDGSGALELVTRMHPDVAIVDVEVAMPSGDGRTLVQAIREAEPEIWVVVLADDISSEPAQAALAAGATGVLAKDGSAEMLAGLWSDPHSGEDHRAVP